MAKILSQEEIDALLSTVADDSDGDDSGDGGGGFGGGVGGQSKRVSLYDFKHPNLISKEQMRLLENIHENFSRNFGVFLSAQLRMIVEIELLAIDQLLYSEFVMSIAPPGCLYVMDLKDPLGEGILELSPSLVIFIVEKLFGGKGTFSAATSRSISIIEQRIMGKVMERAAKEVENVWSPVVDLSTEITRFESNPEFIQIVPSAEPVVVVSLQVKIHDNKTLMNFCYPYRWLSELVSSQDVQEKIQFGSTESSIVEKNAMKNHLNKVNVSIEATLGNAEMTVSDFINLKIGDLIVLDSKPNDESPVFVRDKMSFMGVIGRNEKYRAIQITQILKEEVEDEV